jgi:hypothetical protein
VPLIQRAFPAALVLAVVGWMAVADGGFFDTSWGWPTLIFLLTATVGVVRADRLPLGWRDAAFLLGLAAFVGWGLLSTLWAPGAELPIRASELAILYLVAVAAFLVLDSLSLPLGVLGAATAVAAYSLATRLIPDHVGTYAPQAGGYLLAGPTGYQNCLGMLCALSTIIALGLVAHAVSVVGRVASAISLVILLPTLYFTFSRGAVAALVLGVLAALALDPLRLRLSVALSCALPVPLLGVWLCSRSRPLTHAGAPLSAAAHDGHRLAAVLLALAVVQAGAIVLLGAFEARLPAAPRARKVYLVVAGLAAAAVVVTVLVRIGNPVTFVSHATDAFKSSSPAYGGNLNDRLVTFSGHTRSAYWDAAWQEVRAHPLLGGGDGTFRRYWIQYRSVPVGVLNAHNLYLETLAELGPVGLALLLGALAVPLTAFARVRRHRYAAVYAAAYLAALLHAAIDWDWQLPALTLSTLALGATLVVAARDRNRVLRVTGPVRVAAVTSALLLVALVFVTQLGNNAVAASERAAARGDERAALQQARRARDWLPWAAEPWKLIGQAQLALGETAAARASFREATRWESADWSSWLDLAETSSGSARRKALADAARLNPLAGIRPGSIR